MTARVKKPVQSRAWSCSELKEGQDGLLKVKKETEGEEALKKKIQDPWGNNGQYMPSTLLILIPSLGHLLAFPWAPGV